MQPEESFARVQTGLPGLDEVLHGGLPEGGVYLLEGGPGTGKTTLGMQFLLNGAGQGETGVFISLAQPEVTLHRVAKSHGWSLDDIHVLGITPKELIRPVDERQDVFLPEDVELVDLTRRVREAIDDVEPDRIVFDSLTFLKILTSSGRRYREELVSLVEFLAGTGATSLLTMSRKGLSHSRDVEAMTDGVLRLEQVETDYGSKRFRMMIGKLRASDFRGGYHDFNISTGGLVVFPRIVPIESGSIQHLASYESGLDQLDELVGGGLAAGTSCLIIGPSGTGKTSLATKYIEHAAENGSKSVIFLFEEVRETFLMRAAQLDMDLTPHVDSGAIVVRQIEAALVSPGEFSIMVRDEVAKGVDIVVIDSLTGYFQSMQQKDTLLAQIRDLIRYLDRREILSIMTVSQRGLVARRLQSPLDVSESADTVMLLRYFESRGGIRKALSVVKKRYGNHMADIRELMISPDGIRIGSQTHQFSGVLSGEPTYEGEPEELLGNDAKDH